MTHFAFNRNLIIQGIWGDVWIFFLYILAFLPLLSCKNWAFWRRSLEDTLNRISTNIGFAVWARLNQSVDVNLVHISCAACTDWRSTQLSLLKEQQVCEIIIKTSEMASAFKSLATSSCKNLPMFRGNPQCFTKEFKSIEWKNSSSSLSLCPSSEIGKIFVNVQAAHRHICIVLRPSGLLGALRWGKKNLTLITSV